MKQTLIYSTLTIGLILISYSTLNLDVPFDETLREVSSKTGNSEFNTLVWSDEFNGEGAIDPEKWFHQTQLPPGGSWV